MVRLLLLFGLFLVAAYLVADRVALLLAQGKNTPGVDRVGGGRGELVPCAGCGVHVPRARALELGPVDDSATRFFCSERCRELAAKRR